MIGNLLNFADSAAWSSNALEFFNVHDVHYSHVCLQYKSLMSISFETANQKYTQVNINRQLTCYVGSSYVCSKFIKSYKKLMHWLPLTAALCS
jgi:hypothetical protein